MKEIVYISGAISSPTKEGVEANLQKFVDKGVELFNEGLVPFLPGENNAKMGKQGNWTWKDFMKADIPVMLKCDTVYMLSNWRESRGARIEHFLAKRKGMKIIYEA